MERAQSRAFNIIGINEQVALEKYSIGTVRQFIEHTCVNTIKRMLANPEHKLAEKLAYEPVRETRGAFRFRLPVARTESYNNSIVPSCVRVLRDGEAALYNPFMKKGPRIERSGQMQAQHGTKKERQSGSQTASSLPTLRKALRGNTRG